MKSSLQTFLILLLLLPVNPIGTHPKLLPEICPICQHVCCCPEMCAPKIRALKSRRPSCANSFAHCRLSSDDQNAAVNSQDPIATPEQRPSIFYNASLAPDVSIDRIAVKRLIPLRSPILEIHTPPPRLIV